MLGDGEAAQKPETPDAGLIVEATDANFVQEGIEASRDKPVIVDFSVVAGED